jgi:hypothetical protein
LPRIQNAPNRDICRRRRHRPPGQSNRTDESRLLMFLAMSESEYETRFTRPTQTDWVMRCTVRKVLRTAERPCRPATIFDFRSHLARGRAHALTEGKCWRFYALVDPLQAALRLAPLIVSYD